MRITWLSAENFRNLQTLELDINSGKTVLFGGNAQGKTNLLEAIHLFATSRSVRAGNDRELLAWEALQEEIPFTRLKAEVERLDGTVRLELVIQISPAKRPNQIEPGLPGGGLLVKRARVNGVPKRASELVGEMTAVMFTPQDIELVGGTPSSRRRYMDAALSQVNRPLSRQLQRYDKVLSQRNQLLRMIRERRAKEEELSFWDGELVELGASITERRTESMEALKRYGDEAHRDLAGGQELELRYLPSISSVPGGTGLVEGFRRALLDLREREVARGISLIGPHRDDFEFLSMGRNLGIYGSRGQQRTAALALKLAQAKHITEATGEQPVLLLDDAFSELDRERRNFMLGLVSGWEQAVLTTAELDSVDNEFRSTATVMEVSKGCISKRLGL